MAVLLTIIHKELNLFLLFSEYKALPPPSPKQIAPSGVRWEYWKDSDFEVGYVFLNINQSNI